MSSIDKVRIVIAGDSGCGKSSFAYLIANNEVLTNAPYTVGCSLEVKLHEFREDTAQQKTFWLEFLDLGGSLAHKSTRGVFYTQINGIILVHDLTNRKSYENLKNWLVEIVNKESGKDTIVKSSFADDLDCEQFQCQIPVLVVGTKVDLLDEKLKKNRSQKFATDIGAEEISINCRDSKSFLAGTTDSVKLSRFFDKVIEKKYYSRDSSTFVDKRKFTNIQSPDASHRYVSPFQSPLGNYSNFSSNLANFPLSPTNDQ